MISPPFSGEHNIAEQGVLDNLVGGGSINLAAVNRTIGGINDIAVATAILQPQLEAGEELVEVEQITSLWSLLYPLS